MYRLLQIELKKLAPYRPFRVLMGLYFFILVFVPVGVLELLKWLKRNIASANFGNIDPLLLPVFHFPDVWQNLAYVSLLSKIILGIVMVISVTNDYSFKTVRQNIIDGLDRRDFLTSKLSLAAMLTFLSGAVVLVVSLISALLYSGEYSFGDIFVNMEFVLGYCLELFAYLLIAILMSFLVKKSGFTIALLLVISPLEYLLTALLPDSWNAFDAYFPQHAIGNVVTSPFAKYMFQEIQDYIDPQWAIITIGYGILFIFLMHLSLKKKDL